jgi:simple sugar transport system substrate-binding protein
LAQGVADGSWEQTWEWNGPDWDNLGDVALTDVGWISGDAIGTSGPSLQVYIDALSSGALEVWEGPINLQDGSAYIADDSAATNDEIWYLPQLLEGMTGPSG